MLTTEYNLVLCEGGDSIDPATAAILEVSENVKNRYLAQARSIDSRFLLNALAILSEADTQYRTSLNTRLLVELSLLKLCSLMGKLDEKKKSPSEIVDTISYAPSQIPTIKPISSLENQVFPTVNEPDTRGMAVDKPAEEGLEIRLTSQPEQVEPVAKVQTEPIPIQLVNETEPSSSPVQTTAEKAIQEPVGGLKAKLKQFQVAGMHNLRDHKDVSPSTGVVSNETGANLTQKEEKRLANDFDLNQLWAAWDRYSQQIKKEDRQSYYATLSKHQPIMKEKYQIEFLVDNHVQKGDVDLDRINLIGFLRETLSNFEIQLSVIIDDQDTDDGDSLYEPSKKYEAMLKDNPTLETFRKRFDLDIDFDA